MVFKHGEKLTALLKDPDKSLALLQDMAKRWLAHDGLWFQAVEREYGMDAAIKLDIEAWEQFTAIEAHRIKQLLDLPDKGGIPALKAALGFRLYAFVNEQEIIEVSPNKIVFRMKTCRVQAARRRKNLPAFPCKQVGLVEYTGFAKAIDSRIETRCITCPPDECPADYYCAWEFSLNE